MITGERTTAFGLWKIEILGSGPSTYFLTTPHMHLDPLSPLYSFRGII